MIVGLAAAAGAAWGAWLANKRGGNRLDIAQYAAGFAIFFGVLGLLATVLLDNFLI